MRNSTLALVVLAMLVTSSCNDCKSKLTLSNLKEVTYTKPDGTVYNFAITQDANGYNTATDATHGLVVKTLSQKAPSGASYISGILVSNDHGTTISNITVTDSFYVDDGNPFPNTVLSFTADTTLPFNTGNYGYNIFGYNMYSFGSAPTDYYVNILNGIKDSLHTATAGVYDTSVHNFYLLDMSRGFAGDSHYNDPSGQLFFWVVESAIGYSNSSLGNIAPYIMHKNWGVDLTSMAVLNNADTVGAYNYTWSLNKSNYTVTSLQVTDRNGGISNVTYTYH